MSEHRRLARRGATLRSLALVVAVVSSACAEMFQAVPPPDLPAESQPPPPSEEDAFTERMLTEIERDLEARRAAAPAAPPAAPAPAVPPAAAAPPAAPAPPAPVAPAPPVGRAIPPALTDLFTLIDVLAGPEGASREIDDAFLAQVAADIPRQASRFTTHSSDSVPARAPSHAERIEAEMALVLGFAARDAAEEAARRETLSCGQRKGYLVVCPTTPDPRTLREYWLFAIVTGAPIPQNDPKGLYTFGTVLDTDGSPQNDFRPDPAFKNDFYTGTDRWYEVNGSPKGWTLDITVNAATGQGRTQSGARALMKGNALLLLIPKDEMPAGGRYRGTTFRHEGDFGMAPPHNWSGDLSPTLGQSLRPISDARVTFR